MSKSQLSSPASKMVATKDYDTLHTASCHFLSDDNFGCPDIEDVMNSVFGSNRTGEEAVLWVHYWVELNMYKESLQTGVVEDVPMVHK